MKRHILLLLLVIGCFSFSLMAEHKTIMSNNRVKLTGQPNRMFSDFDSYRLYNNTDKRMTVISPKSGDIIPHQSIIVPKGNTITAKFEGGESFVVMDISTKKSVLDKLKAEAKGGSTVKDNAQPAKSQSIAQVKEPEREKPVARDYKNNKRDKQEKTKREKVGEKDNQQVPAKVKAVSVSQLIDDFKAYLEQQDFYNSDAVGQRKSDFDESVTEMAILSEAQKAEYVQKNNIKEYIDGERSQLKTLIDEKSDLIDAFLDNYEDGAIEDRKAARTELRKILTEPLEQRNTQLLALSEMAKVEYAEVDATKEHGGKWIMLLSLLAALAILSGLVYLLYKRNRSKHQVPYTTSPVASTRPGPSAVAQNSGEGVVVRRRTTSVLKRQDISDVVGNDDYLCIDTADFCENSAVRYIYLKNSCVKDIYNMYAEDLRNSDKPKEDGCMVLGRWVLDGESDQYDVTLEHIVLPGDDAVFAEYELNFGGKIKLSCADKLRRLRRESDLQYDLTCWVHSHPGLGVFFSNSDNNVHNQLKHPTQPHFLTAMVVDILTPDQALGIFTFKRDGTVTSHSDLTRMFSLEEIYQWAIASERNSFNPQDYFNALMGCSNRSDDCRGVELSNGAVIDINQLTSIPTTGFTGYVHGFTRTQNQLSEYIADCVSRERNLAGKELVGCLLVDTHCSLPSVRRMVADELANLHFVLVYSTSNGMITAIPVIGGELCTDESYYGVNKLEDLKIWTRRKR
ncbi:MAG: hypothetical protein J6S96_09280 [Muribaculaceae bacterium]|nr:hypothetical protein [Muribaculaceae bacterium]